MCAVLQELVSLNNQGFTFQWDYSKPHVKHIKDGKNSKSKKSIPKEKNQPPCA